MTTVSTGPLDHPEREAPGSLDAVGAVVDYGPVRGIDDVDLSLPPGSFTAVTGASGAGKTTLLWALAGALPVTAGSVSFADRPIGGREEAAAAGIAVVPQGNALATPLTALENIVVPVVTQGHPADTATEWAQSALAAVGLEESSNHLVEELSGGQQQRLAVARALALRPLVLLADEPTSDLDAVNRSRVVALLRAEADAGVIVVMATHDPEAGAEADTEYHLDEGRLTRVR